jgi:hypothetical protein
MCTGLCAWDCVYGAEGQSMQARVQRPRRSVVRWGPAMCEGMCYQWHWQHILSSQCPCPPHRPQPSSCVAARLR